MLVETPTQKLWLIGDPHFGRDFRNGTPLHRRGEREAMQRAQFIEELNTPDVDVVVMVGDLFDKPFVPFPILSQVINDVVDAALALPKRLFVYDAGNHDKSRQLEVQGAWGIFRLAVNWLPNVLIVDGMDAHGDVAFFAWDWGGSALEQVERFFDVEPGQIHTVIGHWDMMSFGGDDSYICPVEALQEKFGKEVAIYSGHYHEAGDYRIGGVDVHCTGSMQPYTHAEDPDGELYVTLTVEEALARDDLQNKCVRIILEPGEVLPDIDCLQLTKKRADVEAEEIDIGEIGLGNFDIHAVLETEFNDNEVPDDVRTFIKERMGAFA